MEYVTPMVECSLNGTLKSLHSSQIVSEQAQGQSIITEYLGNNKIQSLLLKEQATCNLLLSNFGSCLLINLSFRTQFLRVTMILQEIQPLVLTTIPPACEMDPSDDVGRYFQTWVIQSICPQSARSTTNDEMNLHPPVTLRSLRGLWR